MAKKFKVTCFNTKTYKVTHKYWVTFIWDAINHRWIEKREDLYGRTGEHFFSGSPEESVKRFLEAMDGIAGQYWTVKPVAA